MPSWQHNPHRRRSKEIIGLVALERGVDETDIERDGLPFVDLIMHAAEPVLRGTGCSLLLSLGRYGEAFRGRVRALPAEVDAVDLRVPGYPPP